MIDVTQRRAADAWFLDRGLPAVLRPGALGRRLWPRSAPVLAGFAVFMANSALVVATTGKHTIDINGHPTRTEWFVLALLVLVLPVAVLVGWWVSRLSTVRGRSVAATVAVSIAIAGGVLGGPSPRVLVDLLFEGIVIAAILALTACGAGSILGWAVQMTTSNLAAAGSMVGSGAIVVGLDPEGPAKKASRCRCCCSRFWSSSTPPCGSWRPRCHVRDCGWR